MFEILIIIISIIAIIVLKFVLNIKFRKLKAIQNKKSENLEAIAQKYPDSINICKKILEKYQNNDVIIKENNEYSSCLYTVFNNTITIGKFAQEYMKIQTIAHECIHACQNKITLWSNFIFTNIYIIYFTTVSILNILNRISNNRIHIIILIFMGLIQYIIRYALESEAMIKAKYIAKEYIEEEKILTKQEEIEILKEYTEINKIAIPFINFYTITMNMLKVLIYAIISII